MTDAGIILCMRNGLPALRTVLHDIRDTVDRPHELVVLARDCGDQDATYLLRQYLRGRIGGYQVDTGEREAACGLGRAYHMVRGEYLVLVEDTLRVKPGWLDKAIAALEADPAIGCLSLVQPPDYQRKRGRPPTVNIRPQDCTSLDMCCCITRRELVRRHECGLLGEDPGGCAFQQFLTSSGLRLAYLPGVVEPLAFADEPPAPVQAQHEAELPVHEGAAGSMQRLEQAYSLGDDLLLTCLACGETELEVQAARVKFCEAHQVAIGFWYELRCPACNELQYMDDLQFRCPS